MTSDDAYVWVWLPGQTEPVLAGRATQQGSRVVFGYAESYLARSDRMSIYTPELPLVPGTQQPGDGLRIAGALRDGSPDWWGRAVIERRLGVQEGVLREVDFMLESGSNRFGALDFQERPDRYVPRSDSATLDELHSAAERLEEGLELSPQLYAALIQGTSLGGARPKATLTARDGTEWLAKFSSTTDRIFSAVNAEAAMLELARRAGLDVPESRVVPSLGKEVLLVRRFDRDCGTRRAVVSALTMAETDEMVARYVTYPSILDVLRAQSATPASVGPELFRRIALNIAISNNDDHARNHAAFWDGEHLELTPAYDLAPGARSGDTFMQAMAYGRNGERESSFATLVAVSETYGLSAAQGREIVDGLRDSIETNWPDAADAARLTAADRKLLRERQVLPRAAFYGYTRRSFGSNSSEQPRGKTTASSNSGSFRERERSAPEASLPAVGEP